MTSNTATKFDINKLEKQFSGNFEKIDQKFEKIDERFDAMDKKIDEKIDKAVEDLSEIISGFANQVAEEFKKANKRLNAVEKKVDFIMSQLDAMSKKQELDDDERLVMGHQLDRMDIWIHELADKIGYKLSV